MKASELSVEVKASLQVSRSTAEACLKLVELYLNDNKNCHIRVDYDRVEDNYSYSLEFIDVKEKEND